MKKIVLWGGPTLIGVAIGFGIIVFSGNEVRDKPLPLLVEEPAIKGVGAFDQDSRLSVGEVNRLIGEKEVGDVAEVLLPDSLDRKVKVRWTAFEDAHALSQSIEFNPWGVVLSDAEIAELDSIMKN